MKREPLLNLPNIMSLLRILLAPLFVWMLHQEKTRLAGLILLIGWVSDADGYIARKLGQETTFGKDLDYIADALFLSILFLASAYYSYIPTQILTLVLFGFLLRVIGIYAQGQKRYLRIRPLWNKIAPQAIYIYVLSTLLYPNFLIQSLTLLFYSINCLYIFIQGLKTWFLKKGSRFL